MSAGLVDGMLAKHAEEWGCDGGNGTEMIEVWAAMEKDYEEMPLKGIFEITMTWMTTLLSFSVDITKEVG